jgi:general nucleoside transport system ATP-binding protein
VPGTNDAVSLKGITKRFPRVLANDRVDFGARKGEVHALVGENGAGKSTLMKILAGIYEPDEGEVFLEGERLRGGDPAEAIRRGVGMVHQHFMLVPPFTVAENVALGAEPRRGPIFDRARAEADVAALAKSVGFTIDPRQRVEDLSVGEQQRVEILKVLYRGARVLVLDEPTAVLTPGEVEELLRVLRGLREQGKTIIFITHKLREVMALSDRVTVMRRGAAVGTVETKDTTAERIAELMVGRPVLVDVAKKKATPGEVALEVENLCASSRRGLPALRNVSFEVRKGEIFGIAGVEGNGQSELVEVLSGIREATSGRTSLGDASPFQRRQAGYGFIPEDRHRHACVLDMTVWENGLLTHAHRPDYAGVAGVIRRRSAIGLADSLIRELDVRPAAPEVPFRALSGGNQQKFVVARELSRTPGVLVISQLTRGVDIGAMTAIWKKIIEQRDAGRAVLLVSAELTEILSLADRIGVMYAGELVKVVDADQTNEQELGLLMAGGESARRGGAPR